MIDKYNSNELNKAFVILLLYTIQNKQNVECRMFSREKSLKASHIKVVQIPIFSEYLKQFLEPFRMWKHFWNRLEMVRILFENPLWTSGEFGGFCVDSCYML